MKTLPEEIHMIEVEAIRPFIRRTRLKDGFDGLTEAIRSEGLKVPIEVRDITDEPAAERKKPEGGLYRFELIKGEGRTLAHERLGLKKIAAYVVKAKQGEIVGRFLAENMARKSLPWADKARLVKAAVDAGERAEDVARRYAITPSYVYRLLNVLKKTASGIEAEVAALPMNDADALTALPAAHQTIIVEVLRENPHRQVREIIRKAEEIVEQEKPLSTMAVRESLKRVDDELASLRKSLKVTRLHHSLGPQNLQTLLRRPKFRAAIVAAGVNIQRFEEVCA